MRSCFTGPLAGRDAGEARSLANELRHEQPGANSTMTALDVEFVFDNGWKAGVSLPAGADKGQWLCLELTADDFLSSSHQLCHCIRITHFAAR